MSEKRMVTVYLDNKEYRILEALSNDFDKELNLKVSISELVRDFVMAGLYGEPVATTCPVKTED